MPKKQSISKQTSSITEEQLADLRALLPHMFTDYSNPDNDPRGAWTSVFYVSQRTKSERPNLSYKIKNPFTGKLIEHPTNAWKYSKEQNEVQAKEERSLQAGVISRTHSGLIMMFLSTQRN